ncbi:hypothetical protein ACL2XO_16860 [Sodalis sp. RH15]|uniref:hypothetical protein n=1 Tax=Sodalis sp. RH15 TaxID=3394330 RepID=UPI0039B59E51
MTVSFYGLTIPPDVFQSPPKRSAITTSTLFPIYGNAFAPRNSRYPYFPPDEKTATHFSDICKGFISSRPTARYGFKGSHNLI